MKSWRARLVLLFALSAMLIAVSVPATAQEFDEFGEFGEFDEFDDLVTCIEIDINFLLCDGDLFVEADDFFEAEAEVAEAEAEAEEEEAEAEAEEDEEDEDEDDDDEVGDD